jgi:hypothetical protein
MKEVKLGKDSDHTVKAYQAKDFESEEMQWKIEGVQHRWLIDAIHYVQNNPGNCGTCVLGAEISIWFLRPRARYARRARLIAAPRVSQGSLSWEDSVEKHVEDLKEAGIDCWYHAGRMD